MLLSEILQYAHNHEQLSSRFIPEVRIFESPSEVDAFAAERLVEQIQIKPHAVLTLPTGNTPVGMYGKIVSAHDLAVL